MAIVYRVENWEGLGPYSRIAPPLPYSPSLHPEPDLEGLRVDRSMSFGFADLFQLMLWFSADEIQTLGRWGEEWLISQYSVAEEHLQSSSTQTVFRKGEAELLGCLPLDELGTIERYQGTRKMADALEASLQSRFSPHAPCEPASQHSLLSGDREFPVTRERINAQLRHLRNGCYYSVDYSNYVYRNSTLYEVTDEHGPVEADLRFLTRTVCKITHITVKS